MATTISGDNGIDKVVDGSIVEADIANAAVTTNKIADANITPAKLSQKLTSGTAVTASGTSVDFTSIPSWVKRITVMFGGVSTNGSSNIQVRLGTSSGVVSTGYSGCNTSTNTTSGSNTFSSGFDVARAISASFVMRGNVTITNISGNDWSEMSVLSDSTNPATLYGAGAISLGGTLDRIRITTANGTDTFDAGSINILYE